MKRVCVFCGSAIGPNPKYLEMATRLGKTLAREKIVLVYGGTNTGIMGQLANSVLANRGDVIGVLPKETAHKEIPHHGLTELRLVETLDERKKIMLELSDAFVAFPGGIGTLDEFCGVFVLSLYGFHQKPCILLNVNQYFNKFIEFLHVAVEEGFMKTRHLDKILIEEEPEILIQKLLLNSVGK